jgi:sortase A
VVERAAKGTPESRRCSYTGSVVSARTGVTRTRTGPLRAVVRFVASVMTVSGTLMIADAAVTLTWQEPITALLAKHQQSLLKDKLADAPARVLQRRPLRGDAIGRIVLPPIHRSYYVVEGADLSNLAKGPGHYHDTPLPGERGTVGIAGHRTTHGAPFRHIDRLKRGERVIVEMPYGTYIYRVEKKRIVNPDDLSVKRKVRYDRLMLSSCHPPYSAAKRYIVFARFVARRPGVVGPRRG